MLFFTSDHYRGCDSVSFRVSGCCWWCLFGFGSGFGFLPARAQMHAYAHQHAHARTHTHTHAHTRTHTHARTHCTARLLTSLYFFLPTCFCTKTTRIVYFVAALRGESWVPLAKQQPRGRRVKITEAPKKAPPRRPVPQVLGSHRHKKREGMCVCVCVCV